MGHFQSVAALAAEGRKTIIEGDEFARTLMVEKPVTVLDALTYRS